jgi:metal-sulfur cluster biosynthetic enzyme
MKTCAETTKLLEQSIREALFQVIDPEVGENIVDLGLVYGIKVAGNIATVDMTMTTPACPMGEMLLDDIHEALSKIMPQDITFDVNLVWEPPWDPSMISAEAKQRLGWD